MDSGRPCVLSDPLTQEELEAALLAGTHDVDRACLTYVAWTLVVFLKAAGLGTRCVHVSAVGTDQQMAARCQSAAIRALHKHDKALRVADKIVRTLDVEVGVECRAAQVQVIAARDVRARDALSGYVACVEPPLPSAFALILPDVAWAARYPTVAGGLVAVYTPALPVGSWSARVLVAVCCASHANAHARRRARELVAAAVRGRRLEVVLGRSNDSDVPGGFALESNSFTIGVEWMAAPVALETLSRARGRSFLARFDEIDEAMESRNNNYR